MQIDHVQSGITVFANCSTMNHRNVVFNLSRKLNLLYIRSRCRFQQLAWCSKKNVQHKNLNMHQTVVGSTCVMLRQTKFIRRAGKKWTRFQYVRYLKKLKEGINTGLALNHLSNTEKNQNIEILGINTWNN